MGFAPLLHFSSGNSLVGIKLLELRQAEISLKDTQQHVWGQGRLDREEHTLLGSRIQLLPFLDRHSLLPRFFLLFQLRQNTYSATFAILRAWQGVGQKHQAHSLHDDITYRSSYLYKQTQFLLPSSSSPIHSLGTPYSASHLYEFVFPVSRVLWCMLLL